MMEEAGMRSPTAELAWLMAFFEHKTGVKCGIASGAQWRGDAGQVGVLGPCMMVGYDPHLKSLLQPISIERGM